MKWNPNLYDSKHDFVSRYGEDLIGLIDVKKGEKILDIGCGTGDLTELIRLKGADVTGIDSSAEMIEMAKKKFPLIDFQIQSVTQLPFENIFDAVFSNATLHWVLQKEKAIGQIYKTLKPGGRFVAELGGKGNIARIESALKNALNKNDFAKLSQKEIWYFPSIAEYALILENQGFRVTFAAHFDRETLLKDDEGIKNWLRMFARPFLEGLDDKKVKIILEETEEQLRSTNYREGKWYADYKRLRVVARKD
jgi:trans-aconitate methyltransferase